MPYSDLVAKEAARIAVFPSRAIKDGRLGKPQNRLLHRPGLEMQNQTRIDNHNVKRKPYRRAPADLIRHQLQERPIEVAGAGWWSCVLVAAIGSATSTTLLETIDELRSRCGWRLSLSSCHKHFEV